MLRYFKNSHRRRIAPLLDRALQLGTQQTVMPVEIFNLARELADVPNRNATVAATEDMLLAHENAFVRRVFFTMLRFMGKTGLPNNDISALLLRGLHDPSPWVQYDAAWAIAAQGLCTADIIDRLRVLADGYTGDETISPSDSAESVKKRAGATLCVIQKA